MVEYLTDRERYATLDRDAVAVLCDLVAERGIVPTAFTLANIERFECGGAGHWMAVWIHARTGSPFVLTPGGDFETRADRAGRRVEPGARMHGRVPPLLVCQTPATQAMWNARASRRHARDESRLQYPVDTVSAADIDAWCSGHELRLPCELEWEWFAGAGVATEFCFGDALTGHVANFMGVAPYGTDEMGPYLAETAKVGAYAANAFGLYDVHGNVRELCGDRLSGEDGQSRVVELCVSRGGGYDDDGDGCRLVSRHVGLRARFSGSMDGFRPVADLLVR